MELILFYAFSAVLVMASIMVITIRKPVHAALFLVLAFFTCAGLWILLEAEFLAITLVLVYVGAVMVLFLFVVMMLDIKIDPLKEGFTKYAPVGLMIAGVLVVEIAMIVGPERFGLHMVADPVGHAADYSNTKELGRLIYTTYVYPFEIAAVILVVAIIAAIALTHRTKRQSKYISPEAQVAVQPKDRMRIVKMAADKDKHQNRS
ncbi:MAG: NADH-quinone oxidoreductase subunit J [Gammaproteobacteria bacterium]|nr:NADH-quinone oxidoreductase subunit J [Gammaproteobacteria bacterium]